MAMHLGRALGAEGGGTSLHCLLLSRSHSCAVWGLAGVPGAPVAAIVTSSYNIADMMYLCSAPCKIFIYLKNCKRS